MDKKLKALFEYQHFEKNERLEAMLRSAEKGHRRTLSIEELAQVSAAGTPYTLPPGAGPGNEK